MVIKKYLPQNHFGSIPMVSYAHVVYLGTQSFCHEPEHLDMWGRRDAYSRVHCFPRFFRQNNEPESFT